MFSESGIETVHICAGKKMCAIAPLCREKVGIYFSNCDKFLRAVSGGTPSFHLPPTAQNLSLLKSQSLRLYHANVPQIIRANVS